MNFRSVERMIMKLHFWVKEVSLSEERDLDLIRRNVTVEKFPLIVSTLNLPKLHRIED